MRVGEWLALMLTLRSYVYTATLIGGGIGSVLIGANLNLFNSTVSGNSAPSAAGIQIEEPIDAANPSFCLSIDQQGVTRPPGAGCDIGAFEVTP